MNIIWSFLPECFMFFCILFFVIHGVEFSLSGRSKTLINSVFYSISIVISTIIILINCDFEIDVNTYSNCMLIRDSYSYYLELIILLISIIIFSSTYYYNIDLGLFSFEFYIIMLTCIFSFCLFLHANHMIFLYILVELQSICCYILTSYNKKSRSSIEAGLKYFILGSFSSIIMLFGFSLIYGFTGLSFFDDIAIFNKYIYSVENDYFVFMFFFSIICFLIGFLFKIYAAPFHFWISDIYQGSPTSVTFFLSTIPVLSYLFVFLKLYFILWHDFFFLYQWLFYIFSICSMFFGVIGALFQRKIKKLLAYSTITTVGYVLMGLSCNSVFIFHSCLIFFFVYIINIIPIFLFILHFRIGISTYIDNLSSFSFLYIQNKWLVLALSSFFFSLAGIPPFSGFVVKLLLYQSLISEYHLFFFYFFVITALLSCFYYLRVIKLLFYESDNGIVWFRVKTFPSIIAFFYYMFFFFNIYFFFDIGSISDICYLFIFDYYLSV